ncbi:MAG: LysM peptidoglycan-binding domain-containing protein [bacterium]
MAIKISLLVLVLNHIGYPETHDLQFVNKNLLLENSKTILQVDIKNIGKTLLKPQLWADLYNEEGRYVGRFESNPVRISPGTSARYNIDLSQLQIGTYKALLVGRYISNQNSKNINETVHLLKYIAPFKLPLKQQVSFGILRGNGYGVETNQTTTNSHENNYSEKDTFKFAVTTGDKNEVSGNTLRKNSLGEIIPEDEILQAVEKKASKVEGKFAAEEVRTTTGLEDFEYYTVQTGDWLSKIAQRYYGDVMEFGKIFKANRDILKDPNLIYPGQRLKIPKLYRQNTKMHGEETLSTEMVSALSTITEIPTSAFSFSILASYGFAKLFR